MPEHGAFRSLDLRLLDDLEQPVLRPAAVRLIRSDPHRFAELTQVRTELARDHPLLLQAKALLLCTLPYKRSTTRSVTRSARLGRDAWLHVTFTSVDEGVPLAFGADRTLLGWIQTNAIDDGFVSFETVTEFFRAFGLSDGGREYTRFRERLRRIESLAIHIRYESSEDLGSLHLKPIVASFTPRSSHAMREHPTAEAHQLVLLRLPGRYGFHIDPTFHEYLRENKVPLPLPLMRLFKNSPQAWDFASLVLYRSYAARTRSVIPWPALVDQLGTADRSHRRLKAALAQVLDEIRVIYPNLPARFLYGQAGLQIDPWRPPQAVITGGGVRRELAG